MPGSGRRPRPEMWLLEWLLARGPTRLLVVLLALVPLGTVGYMLIERLTPLDALYQAMITLTTVGYEDLARTTAGRIFNIVFLGIGVGTFVVTLSTVAAIIIEGRISKVIGRQRMEREITEMRDHVVVCGYGRFGQLTARELEQRQVDHVVVDNDTAKVTLAEEQGRVVLHADATEETALRRAGIGVARGVISCLASDADNVYVALTAKEIRPDVQVVTLARDARAESKLRAAGADYVVSPYTVGAVDMTRRIVQPHLSKFLEGTRGVEVQLEEVAVRAGSSLAHKRLNETQLRARWGVTVVALVKTREDGVHYNPAPTLELEPGDILVVVGNPEGIRSVSDACASPAGPASEA